MVGGVVGTGLLYRIAKGLFPFVLFREWRVCLGSS
jgi:hypothetical protein